MMLNGSSTSSSSSSSSNVDIQSWCEVPSIAHFCSLFRQAFDLLEFDIQELEESLLLMGSEDDTSRLVLRLLIRLLKGCSKTFTNNINEDNYNIYLRRLFLSKKEEAEEDNFANNITFECKAMLDDDIDFPDLSLRNRVRILQQLTEYRLDAEDVFDKVKNLEASSLRVDPLGKDSNNVTYWYFYGTRLYKEENFSKADKESQSKRKRDNKKKKKKDKKRKKRKRSSVSSSEDNDDEAAASGLSRGSSDASSSPNTRWSVACLSLQDWQDLTSKYKHSKKKCDRDLYETLNDNFMPEIVKMFADKEREERRKLMELIPKRASSRIEQKRKEKEEKDRLWAEQMEEERRLEEEYDEKVRLERMKREDEEREKTREERLKQRELMKEMRSQRVLEREIKERLGKGDDEDDDDDYGEDLDEDENRRRTRDRVKFEDEEEGSEEDEDENSRVKKGVVREDRDEDEDDEPLKKRAKKSNGSSSSGGSSAKKKSKASGGFKVGDDDDDLYNPFAGGDSDEAKDITYSPSKEELRRARTWSSGSGAAGDENPNQRSSGKASSSSSKENSKGGKARAFNNFTNALLKVGTKSTKDASLDKPVRKTAGKLLETAGLSLLQRRSVSGLVASGLNGGGVHSGSHSSGSLSDKDGSPSGLGGASLSASSSEGGSRFDSLLRGSVGTKNNGGAGGGISFGLYTGHLAIDQNSSSRPSLLQHQQHSSTDDGSDSESGGVFSGGNHPGGVAGRRPFKATSATDGHQPHYQKPNVFLKLQQGPFTSNKALSSPSSSSSTSATSPASSSSAAAGSGAAAAAAAAAASATTKKAFSNWGGEFFKKNLDYRANTNKILEKMSLNTTSAAASNAAPSSPSLSFLPPSSPSLTSGAAQMVGRDGSRSSLTTSTTSHSSALGQRTQAQNGNSSEPGGMSRPLFSFGGGGLNAAAQQPSLLPGNQSLSNTLLRPPAATTSFGNFTPSSPLKKFSSQSTLGP